MYDREKILTKEILGHEQTRTFRGGLGLCLYLAQDRPDFQEAVRVLSTYMGCPTVRATSACKHLACYLKGTAEYGVFLSNCSFGSVLRDNWQHVENQHEESPSFNLEVFCNSNWAGCKATRKSTTSGLVFLNGNVILSMCKTQATVSLSSCEAELMAMTHMTAEAMMISNVCRFLLNISEVGVSKEFDFVVFTDSSSAKSIAQRRGVGRFKHLDIRLLWIQRFVKQRYARLKKIHTVENVADLNTKSLTSNRRMYLFSLLGISNNQTRVQDDVGYHFINKPKVVNRILAVLAGLLLGSTQEISDAMEPTNTGQATCVVILVMVMLALALVFTMARGSRSRSDGLDGTRRRRWR